MYSKYNGDKNEFKQQASAKYKKFFHNPILRKQDVILNRLAKRNVNL